MKECRKNHSKKKEEEEEEFDPKWTVKYEQGEKKEVSGTLSMPSLSQTGILETEKCLFSGVDVFPGNQMHSSTYKEPFRCLPIKMLF